MHIAGFSRYLCAPALLLAALIMGGLAKAEEPALRFGLTGDYPPFAEQRANGSLEGADIDMARKVARAMGRRAEFVLTNWSALPGDFAAGRFDIAIGGLTVTPERAALGMFSLALLDDGKRPLALCRNRRRYKSLADIDRPGVRVQINRGPAIAQLASQWLHRASVVVNREDETLTARLLDGSVDVWITDGVVVDRMARQSHGRLCATTATPFNHVAKAWLIRNDPALIAQVNRQLSMALRTGDWSAALRAH